MTNAVTVKYMSRAEIDRLMFSLNAEAGNAQAELLEAIVRRLLELIEQDNL